MTHTVFNQPPELGAVNLYDADPIVTVAGDVDRAGLVGLGTIAGSPEFGEWGFQANRNEPELRSFDRFGHRIDQVDYHPAYHQLLSVSVGAGITSMPYEKGAPETAHLERAIRTFLVGQIEQGHLCPMSMTYAVMPALRKQPDVAAQWEEALTSRSYDPGFAPASAKSGVLMGMFMTEKQGGSDVRANTTVAIPVNGGGPGGEYQLTGHKWFCSAPMNDAFLVLAQAPGGLSCFLMPRWTPDGTQNVLSIQRLKDKLGNRSNASSEIEFSDAWARMVGEEGRGVATIIEMVNGTRLDCVIGATAIMRQAVTQAVWHVGNRSAFGKTLIDQPLMQNVVADLDIEAQAATSLMLRLASAFDRAPHDEHEALVKRILTPVAKYWVTKRCSGLVSEALECLGGGGYVEESIMPRLYRESPVNAVWEGSGNVIALDVLRVFAKEPRALDALLVEIETTAPAQLKRAVGAFQTELSGIDDPTPVARRIIDRLAVLVSASALGRYATEDVLEAYVSSRVSGDRGLMYGTLSGSVDHAGFTQRAYERLVSAQLS